MTTDEDIWHDFLEAYLVNVKRLLPESYRARQLHAGGVFADAVYNYETAFMKIPFMQALKKKGGTYG